MANELNSHGASAEIAVLDALDEQAVDAHLEEVLARAGGVDIALNLIGRGDVQGTPLIAMATDDLLRAVINGLKSKTS